MCKLRCHTCKLVLWGKDKNLASLQITSCLSMFKVNEIIHLYVNLSVLEIQIENKQVAAMDCFTLFLFGHCLILPT